MKECIMGSNWLTVLSYNCIAQWALGQNQIYHLYIFEGIMCIMSLHFSDVLLE